VTEAPALADGERTKVDGSAKETREGGGLTESMGLYGREVRVSDGMLIGHFSSVPGVVGVYGTMVDASWVKARVCLRWRHQTRRQASTMRATPPAAAPTIGPTRLLPFFGELGTMTEGVDVADEETLAEADGEVAY